jgi:hypothetical protein
LEFVELKLQKADSELFSHMKDIDARRKLVEQLNTLAGEVKALTASGKGINSAELKKGAEGTITVYIKDPITGKNVEHKSFPNTAEGKAQADKLVNELGKFGSQKVTPSDPAKAAQYDSLIDKYEELAKTATAMGKGDLAAKLQGIADDIKAGKNVSKETLEDASSAIEAAANELTSSADMTMLKMQTLMQDRSRILTWVTNAIKAMTEPQDQMARNIG